ncbi:hypothetical protein PENTCL1PPCAC_1428, partial [Pristionchus entomophagus]
FRTSIAVESDDLIDEGSSTEFGQPRSRKRARSVASHVDSSKEDVRAYSTSLHGSRTRFLKNKLLDNLNKYFGEESGALEILSSEDPAAPEGSWNAAPMTQPQPQQQWGMPPATNPWLQQPQPMQQPPFQQPIPHAVAPPAANPWLTVGLAPIDRLPYSTVLQWTTAPPFQPQPFGPLNVHPTLIPSPPPLDARQQRSGHRQHFDWKPEPKSRLQKQSQWEQSAERTITKTGMAGDTSGETQPQKLMTTQRVTPKKRKRGESTGNMNRDTMETIRSWRNRLYKAFKRHDGSNHSMQPTRISRLLTNNTSGGNELLEFNNQTPLIADKNLQVLKSRDQQSNHVPRHVQQQPTYGMDPSGKIAPMFGMERHGYRFSNQPHMPVDYSQPSSMYLPASAQPPRPFYSTPPPPVFYSTPAFTYSTPAPSFTLFPPLSFRVCGIETVGN